MPYHEVPQGLHVLTLLSRVCGAPTYGASDNVDREEHLSALLSALLSILYPVFVKLTAQYSCAQSASMHKSKKQ